ncbi:neural cell adhesion molecule 1-A-like [Dysidea avara]|uniref:neural cell adhesion molecule 1-A-like n=1 Tax=Dysidea avara TaxID=196820 RepID=UPI003318D6B0
MFYKYIIFTILGCFVNTTCSLTIIPHVTHVMCSFPTNCGKMNLVCISENLVEWLNPISEVISANNKERIHVQHTSLIFHNRSKMDEGMYTCRSMSNHSIKDEVMIKVNDEPRFIYTSAFNYYYEEVALWHRNKFINCSVKSDGVKIHWEHNGELLWANHHPKYSQNNSGLLIHNVTTDDQGQYSCLVGNVNPLNATVKLNVVWPPELLSSQNQTVLVNVSEQVVLNCTVSSSPGPVYNWSIPDTCSSCPHTNKDSVMIFTADSTDSGEYVCEAGNQYGSVYHKFTVLVTSKPLTTGNITTIIKENDRKNNNVVLSCGVYYAHPIITWTIMTESSSVYHSVAESSTGQYTVHKNGSLEVFHHFILESDHLICMCTCTGDNIYGSVEQTFHLWDHNIFYQVCTIQSVRINVKTVGQNATVTFSVIPPHPDVQFHCKIDNSRYTPCSSPLTYYKLSIKSHHVILQAACLGQLSWQRRKVRFRIGDGK